MFKKFSIVIMILWMGVIFGFSNQNADDSLGLSDKIILNSGLIDMDASPSEIEKELDRYTFPIRKLAHFSEYFILGLLVLNVILQYDVKNKVRISILICILYSVLDEFHQLFVDNRTARILDVLIDSLGSCMSIFIMYYLYNKYRHNKIK